jgi:hypothetical protein
MPDSASEMNAIAAYPIALLSLRLSRFYSPPSSVWADAFHSQGDLRAEGMGEQALSMFLQQIAPTSVAKCGYPLSRANDVRKENRGEDPTDGGWRPRAG